MNKWVNFTSSSALFKANGGEFCEVQITEDTVPLSFKAKLFNGELWMLDRYAPLDGWARYDIGDKFKVMQ